MRESARMSCEDINFGKYVFGSTYFPLEADMILQREIHEKNRIIWDRRCEDHNGNDFTEIRQCIRKIWLTVNFPVQKIILWVGVCYNYYLQVIYLQYFNTIDYFCSYDKN